MNIAIKKDITLSKFPSQIVPGIIYEEPANTLITMKSDIKIGPRKVGKRGKATCLLLPAIWLKTGGISAGDTVNVSIKNSCLIITPEAK